MSTPSSITMSIHHHHHHHLQYVSVLQLVPHQHAYYQHVARKTRSTLFTMKKITHLHLLKMRMMMMRSPKRKPKTRLTRKLKKPLRKITRNPRKTKFLDIRNRS